MELSILKLQDPAPARPVEERRGRIRHKLHSPAYASFNGQNSGMVLELSELLDLSEDGFAAQTSQRLPVKQSISLSLDLPETKAYIHGAGQVIWSDGGGRSGIRFAGLTQESHRLLKEWLFVNLLLACQQSAARTAPVVPLVEKEAPAFDAIVQSAPAAAAPVSDLTGMLSAVEAVRREVRAAGDFDAALHLITDRALSLTGASGAALAVLTDDKMICRASSGKPALPLGTAVNVKHGLTGECIRCGRMVACEDVETDARVDREICRLLGIGSVLASPILADFRVVGLIEVFSPHARAFTQVHETALERLAELVPKAQAAAAAAHESPAELKEPLPTDPVSTSPAVGEAVWEPEREAQEPLKGVPVRLVNIVLLVLTVAMVALVSGYLLAPKIERVLLKRQAPVSRQVSGQIGVSQASTKTITRQSTFDEERGLAEQGDSEAQYDLGSRYHNGEAVPRDDVQAAKWFQRAAEQGHVGSQRALGTSFWSGRGVPRDLSKAYFWSAVAANQGDAISASQMQGLSLQMTRAQVAAAQSQADDWLRQHRAAK